MQAPRELGLGMFKLLNYLICFTVVPACNQNENKYCNHLLGFIQDNDQRQDSSIPKMT